MGSRPLYLREYLQTVVLYGMMGTEIEIFVSMSKFSVYVHLDMSILSRSGHVQEKKGVVLFSFDSELYVRVDSTESGVEFLYVLFN